MLRAGNQLQIDLDRHVPRGELQCIEQLRDGHPIGNFASFAVKDNVHERRLTCGMNYSRTAVPRNWATSSFNSGDVPTGGRDDEPETHGMA